MFFAKILTIGEVIQQNPKILASDENEWPRGHRVILYADSEEHSDGAEPFALLQAMIQQYGGHVYSHTGVAVIAAFERMQDASELAADFQQKRRTPESISPVRMGIHWLGDSSVTHLDDRSLASRIAWLAEGGQVLLSEAAKAALCGTAEPPLALHCWPSRRLIQGAPTEDLYELLYPGRTPKEPGARFFLLAGGFTGTQEPYVVRKSKEDEVLQALLSEDTTAGRVVALLGPSGAGKTRLAVRCAVDLAGLLKQNVYFVAIHSPTAALREGVASRLGERIGLNNADRDPAGVLAWAARTESILVLDHDELMVSADGRSFIESLVRPGKVRVLLTSSSTVRTASLPEWGQEISLQEGMEPDEAERLFVETVQRQVKGWHVPEPRQHFEEVLALTSSLPLCVELVAAQLATETLQKIAEALGGASTMGDESVLTHCLSWAWRNLQKADQETLRLCGLFAARSGLSTLTRIAENEKGAVLSSLTRLSLAGLAQIDAVTGDFSLHPSTLRYARTRLEERTDHSLLAARFVRAYRDLLPDDGNNLLPEQAEILLKEWENLLQAHHYAVRAKDFKAAMHFQQLSTVALKHGKMRDFISLVEATNSLTQIPEFALRDNADQWQATLQNTLGMAYSNLPSGDRETNLRAATVCYEAALRVYTKERYPKDWAMTQNNLGLAYRNLSSGDRDTNVRAAIDCYESALKVYTEERFQMDWAMTQNNLGLAYCNLPSGDRDANLRAAIGFFQAALGVRTEERFPMDWAMLQNNLGEALRKLSSGDRETNLRAAIACFECALKVYTHEQLPTDWALTQNKLGNVYNEMVSNNHDANVRLAIACYESALKVYTEEEFPTEWALTQDCLGTAYSNVLSGNRLTNLRAAMACYEAALRVRTETRFPVDWATTLFNRALLEKEAGLDEQARADMERAWQVFVEYGVQMNIEQAERSLRTWTKPTTLFSRWRALPLGMGIVVVISVMSIVWVLGKLIAGALHRPL